MTLEFSTWPEPTFFSPLKVNIGYLLFFLEMNDGDSEEVIRVNQGKYVAKVAILHITIKPSNGEYGGCKIGTWTIWIGIGAGELISRPV